MKMLNEMIEMLGAELCKWKEECVAAESGVGGGVCCVSDERGNSMETMNASEN